MKEQLHNMRFSLFALVLLIALVCWAGWPTRTSYAASACATPVLKATTSYNVGSNPRGAAVADFNLDGEPDLAVANSGSTTVSVMLGRGEGLYNPATNFTVKASPQFVLVSDFNGDGKPDLATTGPSNSFSVSNGFVSVLLGTGNGSFGAAINFNVGMSPRFIIAGDFNGDDIQDLATANSGDGNSNNTTVSILLGDGAGNFAPAVNYPVAKYPYSLATGDFNNDRILDLVVGANNTGDFSVLLGTGAGSFAPANVFNIAATGDGAVAVADFNGDGQQDLALGSSNLNIISYGVVIMLGDGQGNFGRLRAVLNDKAPASVAAADVNGDGKADLVTTSGCCDYSYFVSVMLGDGTGNFGPETKFIAGSNPNWATLADLNGDGQLDLAVTNQSSADVSILFGDGTGRFGTPTLPEGGIQASGAVMEDFNGDGRPDLANVNTLSNDVTVLLNTGNGSLGAATSYGAGYQYQPSGIASCDYNHDGKLDLVITSLSDSPYGASGNISLLIGNGNGGFTPVHRFAVDSSPTYISSGDFNSDGKLDLVVSSNYKNTVTIILGDGATGSLGYNTFAVGTHPNFVAVNDFNGDGKLDLAVSIGDASSVSILLGDGTAHFAPATNYFFGTGNKYPNPIAVADFNVDGKLDLAVSTGNNRVAILQGNGTGGFGAAEFFTVKGDIQAITASDLNGDGIQDLAVTGGGYFSVGFVSILIGDGSGRFGAAINYVPGLAPQAIVAGDVNGDGKNDLATCNYNNATVSLFINSCAATPTPLPALSINDATVTEGDAGTVNLVFNVAMSTASNRNVIVDYYSSGKSAKGGADYIPVSGKLNFAPGETTKSISVIVKTDTINELDESFNLLLANPLNATIARSQGTGTIINDDPPPAVSVSDLAITENNSGKSNAVFTVTLSKQSGKPVVLDYATANGTATAGSDYIASTGTLTIPAGSLTGTIPVSVNGDTTFEPDETFLLNLSNPNLSDATLADGQGQATILNDDTLPSVTIDDATIIEGNAGISNALIQVRLSNGSYQPVTVAHDTADGTASAGSDYVATHDTLTFSPGETSKSITIPIIVDNVNEPDESFYVNLSGPTNAALAKAQAIVSIANDDTPGLQFSDSSYSVREDAGSITINVTRTGDLSNAATVDYATTDGTARQRSDYTSASGTLRYASGEASKSFIVLITDNAYIDGSRTINLSLNNLTGIVAQGVPASASLTIIDNDTTIPTTNPADAAQFFVRQQYADFLNRAPDDGGLGYWSNEITKCGADAQCIHDRRVGVADAFFFEPEFQQTGAYVYRVFKAALGIRPTYAQFISDRGRIVVGPALDESKTAYALSFVGRDAFLQVYPRSQPADLFVDSLLNSIKQNSGADLSSLRGALAGLYDGTDQGRAAIIRQVADSSSFADAEYNSSFVLMEYFGYLRRDPDQGGYDFWLGQVNKFPLRNVGIQHAMACSFITSAEYQNRFSPVSTHTNRECPQ
ncbi:MAG: hypothetical protein QOD00_3793 [Blastocatellia bacterium]|nr:hypothetical protein [Blastocatellia bacterium]